MFCIQIFASEARMQTFIVYYSMKWLLQIRNQSHNTMIKLTILDRVPIYNLIKHLCIKMDIAL